jgi:UDP-N-acetylmuramate dehydrogenase
VTVTTDAALAPLTTLGIGGPARRLVTVTTDDGLAGCLRALDDAGEPVLLVAGGSNLVVPDEGFAGTAVHIATRGVTVDERGDTADVTVAAGEPWDDVVALSVSRSLAGLECLSGIPGSTGATPVQNVGAYGQEVADTLLGVEVYDRVARVTRALTPAECAFGYRTSAFKGSDRMVVLRVTFHLSASTESAPIRYAELARALAVAIGDRAPLADVREAVLRLRRGKGMVVDPADPDSASVGSFFTNPVLSRDDYTRLAELAGADVPSFPAGDAVKVPAAWLIERAGFPKGYGAGRVGISTKHTLALVNRGGGTAAELLALAREIRDEVRRRFGVDLRAEPVLVGATL